MSGKKSAKRSPVAPKKGASKFNATTARRRIDLPFDLPSDPPIFPPHADAVEIHAWGHEVSIVFAKMPFQREMDETDRKTVLAVAAVTMTTDFAHGFYKMLGEQLEQAEIAKKATEKK